MNDLPTIARLFSDPGRSAILLRLMGGIALPAGELARTANVAPQTASEHLGRMVEGGLLSVERQGRHKYYRLHNAEVGDAVEALLRLTIRKPNGQSPQLRRASVGTLAHARTCYSHLAGWLGVAITEAMMARGILTAANNKSYLVTPVGEHWFESTLSIPPRPSQQQAQKFAPSIPPRPSQQQPQKFAPSIPPRPSQQQPQKFARQCLDRTERRHHLSGHLGRNMYKRMLELKWLAPMRGTRAVRVTLEGKRKLWDLLRLPLG